MLVLYLFSVERGVIKCLMCNMLLSVISIFSEMCYLVLDQYFVPFVLYCHINI